MAFQQPTCWSCITLPAEATFSLRELAGEKFRMMAHKAEM